VPLGLLERVREGKDVNLRSRPAMLHYHAIARRIAADAPDSVLDWGCGYGQMTSLLVDAGVEVTAFDYRPGLAAPAVEPLERYPGLLVQLSPEPVRLPFADGSFGAVLSSGVLEHVEDPDGSLQEIRRVLRPDGSFYFYNLPNRWSYIEWLAKRFGVYYHGQNEHDRIYTLASARATLEEHGFRIRELRRAHMLPLLLGGPALVWHVSCLLERVPGLNLLATGIEGVAIAPG
jgi:SAM-dependent methyltransferase